MIIGVRYNVVLMFFTSIVKAQLANTEVKAEIMSFDREDYIEIISIAQNNTNVFVDFFFNLKIIKKNIKKLKEKSTERKGRITIKPYERIALTQLEINKDNDVIILLLFYDDEQKMIGRDRVVFEAGKRVTKAIKRQIVEFPRNNDGLELTGIVVEYTKTKAGKDFYDFFYTKYLRSEIKGNKVITISEFIFNGRQSRIDIKIDEKELTKFFVKPNEEYLELMADVVLSSVRKYFSELEKNKEYMTKY